MFPLNDLPWTISGMMRARFSFSRTQNFLDDANEFKKSSNTFNDQEKKVKLSNGIQKWSANKEDKFFLYKYELSLKLQTLNMIIGSVASGKTAFINSFLGELVSVEQNANFLNKKSAFVGQNPWIQHGTIKVKIEFFPSI